MAKDETKMDERFQIAMTAEERGKLEELAAANTGDNKSLLLRKLIELAWGDPKRFDLHPPASAPSASPKRRSIVPVVDDADNPATQEHQAVLEQRRAQLLEQARQRTGA